MTENNNTDWAAFYKDILSQTHIPATASEHYSQTQITVRDLFVNLNDVYTKAREQGLEPRLISVYADVVKITANHDPLISQTSLMIAARRIEVEPGASIILDYRSSQVAKLVIYTSEILGKLEAKTVTSGEGGAKTTIFDLDFAETIGAMISCKDKAPTKTLLKTYDDSGLELGSPMQMLFASLFQVATAVFYTNPEIARSMLAWLTSMTNGSQVAMDIFLQSSALLAQMNVSNSAIAFVPFLDKDVYSDVLSSFIQAANAYQQQYERFSDKKQDVEDRKDAAKLMLQHYQETTQFNTQLLEQAANNFQGAFSATVQAEVSLKIQQSKVQQAGIEFKYDSKIWVREEIIKAVLQICVAVVEFAASIALMAVGDEAAGAQAGAAVAQAAKAAEDAEQVAQQVQEVSKFAQTMKKLTDAMKKLKDVGEALSKMYESINKILQASKQISELQELTDITIPYTDNISVQAEWDAFKIEVDALLKPAIDAEIPGAVDYLVELEKLSVFGKAYMASQVSVVQGGQDLSRLYVQKQIAAHQQERLQKYIDKLSDQEQNNDEMMQMFFERELNIKRWLLLAIQNYRWAYRYWALKTSRVQLSVVKSIPEFEEDLGTITEEYDEALESFNPPPQDFHRITITIPDRIGGEYKDVISNLSQNRSTTLAINLSAPEFDGLGRVRLTTVRVWLEGVKASEANPLYLEIGNSGVYSDRLQGNTYQFTSKNLKRVFKYKGAPGDVNGILVDGKIDDRDRYLYFQPTPFTQWTITVPQKYNPGINLSTLSAIKIEFSGSVNATVDVA